MGSRRTEVIISTETDIWLCQQTENRERSISQSTNLPTMHHHFTNVFSLLSSLSHLHPSGANSDLFGSSQPSALGVTFEPLIQDPEYAGRLQQCRVAEDYHSRQGR